MARTNKRHYALFKREVKYWLNRFGLSEWRVTTFHQSGDVKDARASYVAYAEDRVCSIFLEPDWGDNIVTDELIKRSAFHEVVHVLFCRLTSLANTRCVPVGMIDEEEHVVVHRLQQLFYGGTEEGETE